MNNPTPQRCGKCKNCDPYTTHHVENGQLVPNEIGECLNPPQHTNCCDKCKGLVSEQKYSHAHICNNPACSCHTQPCHSSKSVEDWKEELYKLSEKHCKHDGRYKYDNCLYHIFEPFIEQTLHSYRTTLYTELRREVAQTFKEIGAVTGDKEVYIYNEAIYDIISLLSSKEKEHDNN